MNLAPRRIAALEVELTLPKTLAEDERKKLEEIAHSCPVTKSLHPDLKMPITFHYNG